MAFREVELLRWRLVVDVEATAKAYRRMVEGCTCAYCRNFHAAHAHVPAAVRQTLRSLGVDPIRPAEIVEYNRNSDGTHFYSWWYHVVGQMPSDVPRIQAWLTPDVGVNVQAKSDCVEPGFPSPRLQIEFSANLPWALAESPDDAEIE
jgi:hypothetical protein